MPKTVADVMTRDLIVVKPEMALNEAIKLMVDNRISGMPVVNDQGKLVGVISESDLMWQETGVEPPPFITILDSVIYLQNPARYEKDIHKALGQTVGEVMTEKPITIKPDKPLREAAHILHEKDIRLLPVVNEAGEVIGIVTRGDVIRTMAAEQG